MDAWELKGLSIAVVRKRTDGSGHFDVATRGYGVAGRDGHPVTTETLFPIGSNSKAFAVAAVGHLVANKSVDLEWTSKVRRVLPGFELEDEVATRDANLIDLFSHRTGLPRHDWAYRYDGEPPADFSLRMVKHLRPSTEFRETFQYNNHMFDIGASLVSHLSDVPFAEFVQKHIFDAAGMNATTYRVTEAAAQGKVSEGFFRVGENTTYGGAVHATLLDRWLQDMLAGAGGIASSAEDMATWLQVLLSGGKSPRTGNQVVPASVLERMESPVTIFGTAPAPELGPQVYGLALFSSSYQGHQYIEHGGALNGYSAQITRFPNDGLGVAILTNELPRGLYVFEAVKWRIAEELLDMPLRVDWNTRYKEAHHASLAAQEAVAKARLPPSADAPAPSVPLSALAGTYIHPAYGTLEATESRTKNNSLHIAMDVVLPATLSLTHYAGNTFNATLLVSLLALDSETGFAEDAAEGIVAEFDVEDGRVLGLGVRAEGEFWGAGGGVAPPRGTTARERAEAWFKRVEASEGDWDAPTQIGPQATLHAGRM
ncbi:beta-lactamase/transpeptidase-like protein [Auricularia subglabra TFB-10046 SS5]|nr:beta-lactamase/transpeptidase-like protein [Auricularia subglabra TFB-10046 SS5]